MVGGIRRILNNLSKALELSILRIIIGIHLSTLRVEFHTSAIVVAPET